MKSSPISESLIVVRIRLILPIRIPTKAKGFQLNLLSNNEPHQNFGFFSDVGHKIITAKSISVYFKSQAPGWSR